MSTVSLHRITRPRSLMDDGTCKGRGRGRGRGRRGAAYVRAVPDYNYASARSTPMERSSRLPQVLWAVLRAVSSTVW
ncbi:hypothetical protein EVAR_88497_1 [Eumeta japonica]|uniref:Uncharacterized protein n=1 Tax=Eumeta variegata TaxID=151549 RepID=A0A4C1XVW9_EUMVA|nr:hypothetical protein EVAR_88497_1 [Eumeta japonica]